MNTMRLSIRQSETVPEIKILTLSGRLDTADPGEINNAFSSLSTQSTKCIIAEIPDADVISSAVLGELISGRKLLIQSGGDLVLAGLNLDLKTSLTLMGVNKIFKIYPDVRSAINAWEWSFRERPEQVSLSFPPSIKFVPAIRQLMSRIARQKGYSSKDAFRIETIIDEICNNAVEHRKTDNMDNITMVAEIDRHKIALNVKSISDPAKVDTLKNILKPVQEKVPGIDDRRGRGLALIKLLCADLNINYSESGTSVCATKLKEGQ